MSEILRDPVNQFIIGTIIAVITIVVTIVIYLKSRTRKSFSFRVISRTPLYSISEDVKDDVEILYKGRKVEDVNLVQIEFLNSGNAPIEPKDYYNPVSVSFDEKAQILTSEIAKVEPSSVQASVNSDGKKAVLSQTLLNTGDSIIVKMLVDKLGGTSKIKVDGRIAGVKEIQESIPRFNTTDKLIWVGIIAELLGGIMWAWSLINGVNSGLAYFFFLVFILGAIVAVWPAFRRFVQTS